ncbi:11428_t:CDS:2 [Ambispora gerdemannii]|uniref:11428_t:CDS:1 n=1 Tax=Ambispora gerdemannii TaxID=144530 RepID=A0A9N9EGZ9_9GLOM|nr:11428_t:CDS:2 [Ambispora gerdemannii]
MLNNSLITNNTPLFQYPQQNYTCDNCNKEFQQSNLYSTAKDKQELAQQPTYCPNCIEPTLIVPVPTNQKKTKSKPKKNTVAYYQCMSACCQQGISPKKISQVAQECKHNSLTILAERTQEIQKLNQAYQQIGVSYSLILDKRTAKLEKKNGKELAEIEKLKKEMARLAKLTLKKRGDKN